jgi:nitronate monooxygenase
VVDAVAPIPVIAAGGIADGRGVAAALMLGAEGVWLGTRFIATKESGVSDAYRARVVAASADDTVLTDVFDVALGRPWPDGVSGRAIENRFSRRWDGDEAALRAWAEEHRDEYAALGPEAQIEEHAVWAGEGSGLVTEVESAGDVVARLVREATDVITGRSDAVVRREPR